MLCEIHHNVVFQQTVSIWESASSNGTPEIQGLTLTLSNMLSKDGGLGGYDNFVQYGCSEAGDCMGRQPEAAEKQENITKHRPWNNPRRKWWLQRQEQGCARLAYMSI